MATKKSSGAKGKAAKKGSAPKAAGGAKKGGSTKSAAKTKSLIPPKVKKVAGAILSAAAAGALKGAIEEAVPQVEKATGVKAGKGKKSK